MLRYKVKSINNQCSDVVQSEISKWVESRNHISIININIWTNNDMTYSTILYVENDYNL